MVFVAGSIGAGLSHTVPFLIGMRVIQGLGMGGLTALVQSIMGSIVAPRERGRYSGYMGAVMAVSTVSGPLLGGVIVDSPLGWRWCFYVCIPLAIISLFILQATLHIHTERAQAQDRLPRRAADLDRRQPAAALDYLCRQRLRLDLLADGGLSGARRARDRRLHRVELRAPEPMVPLRVLANRTATLVIVASVAVGIAMFGGTTFLGQYFQIARGLHPDARRPADHSVDGEPADLLDRCWPDHQPDRPLEEVPGGWRGAAGRGSGRTRHPGPHHVAVADRRVTWR